MIKNTNFKDLIDDADLRRKEFLQVEFVKSGRYVRYIDWSGRSWDLDYEPSKIKNVCDELSKMGPSFLTVS